MVGGVVADGTLQRRLADRAAALVMAMCRLGGPRHLSLLPWETTVGLVFRPASIPAVVGAGLVR